MVHSKLELSNFFSNLPIADSGPQCRKRLNSLSPSDILILYITIKIEFKMMLFHIFFYLIFQVLKFFGQKNTNKSTQPKKLHKLTQNANA